MTKNVEMWNVEIYDSRGKPVRVNHYVGPSSGVVDYEGQMAERSRNSNVSLGNDLVNLVKKVPGLFALLVSGENASPTQQIKKIGEYKFFPKGLEPIKPIYNFMDPHERSLRADEKLSGIFGQNLYELYDIYEEGIVDFSRIKDLDWFEITDSSDFVEKMNK